MNSNVVGVRVSPYAHTTSLREVDDQLPVLNKRELRSRKNTRGDVPSSMAVPCRVKYSKAVVIAGPTSSMSSDPEVPPNRDVATICVVKSLKSA